MKKDYKLIMVISEKLSDRFIYENRSTDYESKFEYLGGRSVDVAIRDVRKMNSATFTLDLSPSL